MNKPETKLRAKIWKELRAQYGPALYIKKIHGSPYQEAGIPDLIGCYLGLFFGMEVKLEERDTGTLIQQANIKDIITAQGWAGVVWSVGSAVDFLDRMRLYVSEKQRPSQIEDLQI